MAQEARAALVAAFPKAEVSVRDFSDAGCVGYKLEAHVVSPEFDGMALLARHRAVNAALADMMPRIHALTIKALTPSQAAAKSATGAS
jgi:BolA family transcriptional regulator, general stress-responsive regulator